jgi:hypothetical protein
MKREENMPFEIKKSCIISAICDDCGTKVVFENVSTGLAMAELTRKRWRLLPNRNAAFCKYCRKRYHKPEWWFGAMKEFTKKI